MNAAGMDAFLTFEIEDGVALVGLNRPDKRNAISDAFVEAIAAAAERAGREARAAVLYGHGPHFCAGLDLAEHARKSLVDSVAGSQARHAAFAKIEHGRIPWVSALHGAVVGGGLELAASTHVRVAAADAFFGLPEGQRGIYVGGGGSVRIARLIGAARMADMMLTGRVASAEEAERWNLAQYVVAQGEAFAKAKELAKRAAQNAPFTNYAVVNALSRIQNMAGPDGLYLESFVSAVASHTPEAAAGLAAFLEKRAGKVGPVGGAN